MAGDGARPSIPHHLRSCAACRPGRTCDATAERTGHRSVRIAARDSRPRRGLAGCRRWQRTRRRRADRSRSTAAGGAVHTGRWITDLGELPPSKATLLDVSPRQLLELAGQRLPARYRGALRRFRYGPGICKVDWALSGPVPWEAEACRATATIHLGGTLEEIARSEADVAAGRHPERPFCIAVQPCVLDPGRAPAGKAHLLRLLSRSGRLERGHERADRGTGRAFRTRLSGADAGPDRRLRRRDREAQPQLRRWRHQRRGGDVAPDDLSARPSVCAPTGHRFVASTCAPHRRRRAAASTGCAARAQRARSCRMCEL